MTQIEMKFMEMVPNQLREIAKELKTLYENITALTSLIGQAKENTPSGSNK